jgi:hypothetical protein
MAGVATSIESATASVQSSIIKPRYRDEDIMFSSMSMYDDDHFPTTNLGLKYGLVGSNNKLFIESDYFTGLWYTFLRYILMLFFKLYEYYLIINFQISELYDILKAYFWCFLTILPFPEDVSTVGPAAIFSSSSISIIKSDRNISLTNKIYQSFNQYLLLPNRIGNYILQKSLSSIVPRNRLEIRQVTGRLYIPEHIAFIFEMRALVVPQPPEVPTPFLNYDKKIVIPETKEVAQVLARRAEWSSLNYTHKAAETFRITYEAAKCICWAACSGVRTVTIFESNGYSWKDMPKMCSVILEELKNLTKKKYQVYDQIKLVNLSTSEVVNVCEQLERLSENNEGVEKSLDRLEKIDFLNIRSVNELENLDIQEDNNEYPESIVSPDSYVQSKSQIDLSYTFQTNLTVFFMSNIEADAKTFHTIRIKKEIADELNCPEIFDIPNSELKHHPSYPNYLNNKYLDPELVIKFCSSHQIPYSLSGYPLSISPASPEITPVFISQAKPANFSGFVKGLRILNREMKQSKNR